MIDKLRVWIREAAEAAAERKAAKKPDPPHVTVAEWQVSAARFASNVAMCVLVYFLWLYTLQIAGDRAADLHLTHAGGWVGDLRFWFPFIVGFGIMSFGIPYVAKISIPTFMALNWREHLWPKAWALGIALSVSLVIMAGTFTIQGDAILERDRASAVAVQQVEQSREGLQAQITAAEQRLRDMRNNSNAYMAQAASVGADGWQSYIDQARRTNDARLPMIERAMGAARAADAKQAELDGLRVRLAQSAGTASVERHVTTTAATTWIGSLLDWVESVRAILLSLVMDVCCLMMPWIARHLELARNRQLGADVSGWADDAHRIPDMRAEDPITPQPMKPPREVVRDALTGEELVFRKSTWAKKPPKKGKPVRIEPDVMAMADEKGAVDGGDRAARSGDQSAENEHGAERESRPAENEAEEPTQAEAAEATPSDRPADKAEQEAHVGDEPDQPIPPMSDDDVLMLYENDMLAPPAMDEPAVQASEGDDEPSSDEGEGEDHVSLPDGEGVMVRELELSK